MKINSQKGYIQPHVILSDWIFVFFIVYELGYTIYNPKALIIFGLVENIISTLIILYYNTNFHIIFIFILNVVFTKLIPLYYLFGTTLKTQDYYFSLLFVLVYLLWLNINNTDVYQVYSDITVSIVKNENRSPFYSLMNKLGI
jgi:hypothetical protein